MTRYETDPPHVPYAPARACWVCAAALAPGPPTAPVFSDDYGGVHTSGGAMGVRRIA